MQTKPCIASSTAAAAASPSIRNPLHRPSLHLHLALACGLLLLAAPCARAEQPLPWQHSRQLLLVLAADWDSVPATLQRYARQEDSQPWRPVGEPIAVSLGRSGQGWGRGLHPADAPLAGEPDKHEGDGRAPTGMYALGNIFAYDPREVPGADMPLVAVTPDLVCVDDVASRHYNTILSNSTTAVDWTSAEAMLREDGLYRYGVVVAHNQTPAQPGDGSCIFMHVARGPGAPTAGCTAMDQEAIRHLLLWLNPTADPVLAQFPRTVYERVRQAWQLP